MRSTISWILNEILLFTFAQRSHGDIITLFIYLPIKYRNLFKADRLASIYLVGIGYVYACMQGLRFVQIKKHFFQILQLLL